MRLKIVRLYQLPIKSETKEKTIGEMYVIKNSMIIDVFKTLELGYHDNEKYISCIPCGIYECEKRYSERFGHHFHVKEVEGRRYILIHIGNRSRDTKGCILPGTSIYSQDGWNDEWVKNSGTAMRKLNQFMPDKFILEIEWRT